MSGISIEKMHMCYGLMKLKKKHGLQNGESWSSKYCVDNLNGSLIKSIGMCEGDGVALEAPRQQSTARG
jgi:hypothetical protein